MLPFTAAYITPLAAITMPHEGDIDMVTMRYVLLMALARYMLCYYGDMADDIADTVTPPRYAIRLPRHYATIRHCHSRRHAYQPDGVATFRDTT